MRGIWTVAEVTSAEDRLLARTPDGALMRKAAYGVALAAVRTGARHVVLLVGAGNNGGDALWAGAFLRRRGVRVTAVLLAPDRAHPAGLAALRRSGGRVVGLQDAPMEQADLVIDGIVGLQARGGLRPDAASLVSRVRAPILAVDLPSGIDPDTGVVSSPAVHADITVTFGCLKPAHVLAGCGSVELVDIGLEPELPTPSIRVLDASDVLDTWRFPGPADDKYTQGVTGVAAGSATYPGAAVLSTTAAVLSTSGMVRYAGSAAEEVVRRWPEVVATGSVEDAGRVQAWVVGPGFGTGPSSVAVLRRLLGEGVPLCVDADAITMLAEHPDLWDARDPDTPVVLTPHDREFARIAGREVGPDRVAAARSLASRLDVVVLLKGNTTVIADPDGDVIVNKASSSWAATAGSGDVLSGIIGAVLAGGASPLVAAGAAAWLHDRAATVAADGVPTSASRIAAAIPDALRSLF